MALKFTSGVRNQLLATLACNLNYLYHGILIGWSGPNFILLTSNQTPLESGPITISEASLVVSLVFVGGLIGTIVASIFADRLGRKIPLLILLIPQTLSLVLLYIAKNVYYVYASRLLNGFGDGAGMTIVPRFLSEIADNKLRGTLTSSSSLFYSVGTIISFIIADRYDYYGQIKIYSIVPFIFLLTFTFFPETPDYLLGKNKIDLYKKSYKFYRGYPCDVTETVKFNEKSEKEDSLSFSDFCARPDKKALLITIMFTIIYRLNGSVVLTNYVTVIFKESGSTLSPNHSSIVVTLVQLIANFMATFLSDRLGRKILLSISAIGTAIGLTSLGLYTLYKDELIHSYNWISIVSFAATVLIQTMGINSLYTLLLNELLPTKIKNFGIFTNLTLFWLLSFIALSLYPSLTQSIGIHGCMFSFAICCLFGAVFIIIVIPETKGKSYDEIMKSLE